MACRWIAIAALIACRAPSSDAPAYPQSSPLPAAYWREIGTPHPVLLIRSASNGRWAVICQARADTDNIPGIRVTSGLHGDLHGDTMVPYLVRGGGDGKAIDALVATSPDERWLAVMRAGRLLLIDDATGAERVLHGADVRPDQRGVARAAVFDGESKRLVYFRATDKATTVVVRDLARQRDRELPAPAGLIWQVAPEPRGSWAQLRFVQDDTDHSGQLEWPGVDTNAALEGTCVGTPMSYTIFRDTGDQIREVWINLDTGAVDTRPSTLGYVGDAEIVKTADRAIRVGEVEIVPAACDAEVMAVSAEPLRVVATCGAAAPSVPVEMFGPGFHAALVGPTRRRGTSYELVVLDEPCVYIDKRCFALDDGAAIPLHGKAESRYQAKILTSDDAGFFITDTASRSETRLAGVTGPVLAHARSIVAIDETIVDLAGERVLGEVIRAPLAVDIHGRALVSSGGEQDIFDLPQGPLRWVAPRAMPPVAVAGEPPAPTSPWIVNGTAVDASGHPMAGATVTVSEYQMTTHPDGSAEEDRDAEWSFPTAANGRAAARAMSSQHRLPDRTDASGQFHWAPRSSSLHAVMVVADDGRVGAVDQVHPGTSDLAITLRPPGEIHILCRGFGPHAPGRFDIFRGALELQGACDETIAGLPAGRYAMYAELDAAGYLAREVDVASGATTRVDLDVPASGTIQGRVVEYPGDRPIAGIACRARPSLGKRVSPRDAQSASRSDGSFVIQVSQGHFEVWCHDHRGDFSPGMTTTELRGTAQVTVRVVRIRIDGVNAGAAFEAEPDGARITRVAKRAARAGLRVGDRVRAVNGISLAGLDSRAMFALAFQLPPEAEIRWTVVRDHRTLAITSPAW